MLINQDNIKFILEIVLDQNNDNKSIVQYFQEKKFISISNVFLELEQKYQECLSEREINLIALYKYIYVYYSINEIKAYDNFIILIEELHIKDIQSFQKLNYKNNSQYQLIKDTNVDELINILQDELGVDNNQILNVAWKCKQNRIISRHNLTCMTKKQVIEYHINYHKFLEWQNKPQNQTFTPFSNTNSELNQQKFQLVKGSSIQIKQFGKNQLTPSCNDFIPNPFKISNISQKQEVNEDVDVFTDSNFERRYLQNYPIKSQAAKKNTFILSPLHFFPDRQHLLCQTVCNYIPLNNFHLHSGHQQSQSHSCQQQISFWPKFIHSNVSKLETNESYLEQKVKNSIFLKKIRSEEMTLKILKYSTQPRYSINNSLNPKKIMIFGETGADKSTLINFFCNYYIGVQFEFPYRFCLVDDTDEFDFSYTSAFSKFQGVLSYDIIGSDLKPNLRIIDTPEFSDKKEQNLDQFFYKFITDQFIQLESLNLICFVMRLNQNQLSLFQMQIMNRLLQIFGNDVGEHIMFLSTSSDIDETKVSEYLLQPGSPFINILPKIQAPYLLKINNQPFQSLQSKDKEIWDESYSQFKILYEEKICKIKNLNLNLTRLVIQKRNSIQDIIKELKYQIKEHLNLIDNIQNQTDSDINEILKTKQQESLNEFGIKIRKLLLSIKDLNTIALQPLLTDFQQECLGFLIKEEEEQKKESQQMRVQGLRDIQQLWDSISTQLSEHDTKKQSILYKIKIIEKIIF